MTTVYADPLDRAQQIEEQHRAAALARHTARPIGKRGDILPDPALAVHPMAAERRQEFGPRAPFAPSMRELLVEIRRARKRAKNP